MNSVAKPGIKPVVFAFCVSLAVCAVAFIPVMVFTFLGLSGSRYVRETNPLFVGYFTSRGLVTGLFLALVTNLLPAAGVLAVLHLWFYRPMIFYVSGNGALGRKLVVVGSGLFLLAWGQEFFLDSYHDMMVLTLAQIVSRDLLWTVFLGCLSIFAAGFVYWAVILIPEFSVKKVDRVEGGEIVSDAESGSEISGHVSFGLSEK